MAQIIVNLHNSNSLNKRLPSLDGWRAVSIMLVILGHLVNGIQLKGVNPLPGWTEYLPPDRLAGDGVNAFFVISGFIITTLLLQEKERQQVSLKHFYIKRALRIIPVFYLYIITIIVLNAFQHWNIGFAEFLQNFLFLNNFAIWGNSIIIFHAWSLSIEEQFYLTWPWLIKYSNEFLIIALVCCFAIVSAWICRYLLYYRVGHDLFDSHHKAGFIANNILSNFVVYIDALMTGSLFALLYAKSVLSKFFAGLLRPHIMLLVTAVIYLIVDQLSQAHNIDAFTVPFTRTIKCIAFGYWMLHTIYKTSWLSAFLNSRLMVMIGFWSYGLYLWQQLFLVPMIYKNEQGTKTINDSFYNQYPWNIALLFMTAIACYYFFEKPILNWRTKLLRQ